MGDFGVPFLGFWVPWSVRMGPSWVHWWLAKTLTSVGGSLSLMSLMKHFGLVLGVLYPDIFQIYIKISIHWIYIGYIGSTDGCWSPRFLSPRIRCQKFSTNYTTRYIIGQNWYNMVKNSKIVQLNQPLHK